MFLIGGLTIFGLNRLSNFIYNNNKSVENNSSKNENSDLNDNSFHVNESFPSINEQQQIDNEMNEDELENQNNGQIYFKNIEDAYKLLGINEVEEIKEKASFYIKSVLKLTNIYECEVQSINQEEGKIIFDFMVEDKKFSLIKDRDTKNFTIQVEEGE